MCNARAFNQDNAHIIHYVIGQPIKQLEWKYLVTDVICQPIKQLD